MSAPFDPYPGTVPGAPSDRFGWALPYPAAGATERDPSGPFLSPTLRDGGTLGTTVLLAFSVQYDHFDSLHRSRES